MPARSQAQLIAMRIAEHNPDKLYDKNKGLAGMSKGKLQEFTHTPMAGLPKKVSSKTMGRYRMEDK